MKRQPAVRATVAISSTSARPMPWAHAIRIYEEVFDLRGIGSERDRGESGNTAVDDGHPDAAFLYGEIRPVEQLRMDGEQVAVSLVGHGGSSVYVSHGVHVRRGCGSDIDSRRHQGMIARLGPVSSAIPRPGAQVGARFRFDQQVGV